MPATNASCSGGRLAVVDRAERLPVIAGPLLEDPDRDGEAAGDGVPAAERLEVRDEVVVRHALLSERERLGARVERLAPVDALQHAADLLLGVLRAHVLVDGRGALGTHEVLHAELEDLLQDVVNLGTRLDDVATLLLGARTPSWDLWCSTFENVTF